MIYIVYLSLRIQTFTFRRASVHAYLFIFAYRPTCLSTYIHAYKHTHTYCIHIPMYNCVNSMCINPEQEKSRRCASSLDNLHLVILWGLWLCLQVMHSCLLHALRNNATATRMHLLRWTVLFALPDMNGSKFSCFPTISYPSFGPDFIINQPESGIVIGQWLVLQLLVYDGI